MQDIFKDRHTYIGASEAAAVLGVSPYKTPVEVWAEKTRKIVPERIDTEATLLGKELEDYVARRYSRVTGKKAQKVNEPYTHGKYPFLKAHIDRKIVGEKGILQCKTCGEFKAKAWEDDEIPVDYIIQEYHELACSDYDYADIAVLIGNREFKHKRIERDDKVIKDIIAKEVYFWNTFVVADVMPATIKAEDSDILYKLFPVARQGEIIQLDDTVNAYLETLEDLNQDKNAVEDEIGRTKNKLKSLIKDNEIGTTGRWEISWKNINAKAYEVAAKSYRKLNYKKLKLEG